jgi:hypothetical protein
MDNNKIEEHCNIFSCDGQYYSYNGIYWIHEYGTINKPFVEKKRCELDTYKNLFCFSNKIFDLNKKMFIEPKKEYYITSTSGYEYIEPTEENTKLVKKIIDQTFPIEYEKQMYMSLIASSLCGKMCDKVLMFLPTKETNNMHITHLLRSMFGHGYGFSSNKFYNLSVFDRFYLCKQMDMPCDTEKVEKMIKKLLNASEQNKFRYTVFLEYDENDMLKLNKETREKIIPIVLRNDLEDFCNLIFVSSVRSELFNELVKYYMTD